VADGWRFSASKRNRAELRRIVCRKAEPKGGLNKRSLRQSPGSFRAMRPGYGGNLGNVGNIESVTYLTHPGTFPDPFFNGGNSNATPFVVGLAPPFLMIFAFLHAALPRSASVDPSSPMSSYLKQQASRRLWKISMVAAVIAAINLLAMLLTSHSPTY
jgi:hypothetical protein